jgi:transcription antitermination factor NusG
MDAQYMDVSETKTQTALPQPFAIASTAAVAQPKWYALYTSANHERRVAQQLALRCIEHFLPQFESVRRWKDRRVKLQMPLFPGYVFVHLAIENRLSVLQVPGVAKLVGFHGQPAVVLDDDICKVREFLCRGFRAEPHPFLTVGRRVSVKSGPLAGMEGMVLRRKNRSRFVISFPLLQRAVAVDLDAVDLECTI